MGNTTNLVKNFVSISDGIDMRLKIVEAKSRKFLEDKKHSKNRLQKIAKNSHNYKFVKEDLSTQNNFY